MTQNSEQPITPPSPIQLRSPDRKRPSFVPNYTLNERERQALAELRRLVDARVEEMTPKEVAFCDDPCLCRFLRAREWNVKLANEQLIHTLKWRQEFKIDELHPDQFDLESSTGKMYRNGFDKLGRPVIYMKPRQENTKNYDNQVRYLVYTLEQTIASMDPSKGVESWVFLIDFRGMTSSSSTPLSVAKRILDIFTTCYPERLGDAILVDAPYIFSLFFTAISPFIPPVTKSKITFCSGSLEVGKPKQLAFSALFDDLAALEKEYGGSTEFIYDHGVYWENERSSLDLLQTLRVDSESS